MRTSQEFTFLGPLHHETKGLFLKWGVCSDSSHTSSKTPSYEANKVARNSSELQSKSILKKHIFSFTFEKTKVWTKRLSATEFIEPAKNYLLCSESRESKYRRPTWVSTAPSPLSHLSHLPCMQMWPPIHIAYRTWMFFVGFFLFCSLFCFFLISPSTSRKVLVIEWMPSTIRVIQSAIHMGCYIQLLCFPVTCKIEQGRAVEKLKVTLVCHLCHKWQASACHGFMATAELHEQGIWSNLACPWVLDSVKQKRSR